MAFPYSSFRVFASPGQSTVKVYGDRVVSTMQVSRYFSSLRGRGAEGPSSSVSETVYFLFAQAGHMNLASWVSALEEEDAFLRSKLSFIKGRLEVQDAEKQVSEDKYAQNI